MSQQQLQQIIQLLKSQPITGSPSVEETRAGFEKLAGMFPVDADVKSEPVNAGGVKSEWVTAPGADPGRAVLYLHGGGYVIGSINTHRTFAGRISRAAKARVLVIDYRLAPPAAGVPLSPWIDMEGLGDSMKSKASVDPMVQKDGLLQMAAAYLAGK